jgi:hypothetical protein
MLATQAPFPQFFDSDGSPLDDGSLYFGTVNQNPETAAVTVYWDSAGTQPAAQPIRTSNGYAVRNGSPALVYSVGDYSINVRNKQGALVYFAASASAFSNSLSLALDLIDITSAAKGAAMVGFSGDKNYVGRTIGARLLAVGADPRSFGAPADGAGDDTAYWISALLYSKTLDIRNGTWKVTGQVDLPAGCCVQADGATTTAANGGNPILRFLNGNAKLTVYGGVWQGTASSWLFLQGTTNTPTLQAHYASLINCYGVQVTSATITKAVVMDKAVKSANFYGCNFFAANGIDSNAKGVEICFTDCIIFGATGAAGTVGVKLRSPGGTTFYNEGWEFKSCVVDGFETGHDLTDFFEYKIIGGHHGCNLAAAAPFAIKFQAPTTNLADSFQMGGAAHLAGPVQWVASGAGISYNANIDGFIVSG